MGVLIVVYMLKNWAPRKMVLSTVGAVKSLLVDAGCPGRIFSPDQDLLALGLPWGTRGEGQPWSLLRPFASPSDK